MRLSITSTLSLAALGLLAAANPSMAAVGPHVRLLNSSGAPREVHISRPGMQGILSMDLIDPVAKEAGEGSIQVDSETLEFMGGRQMVVLKGGHEVELYLDHDADRPLAELPFWVGDPSEGKAATHYCCFQLRSDLRGAEPAASLQAGLVTLDSPICFGPQLTPDLLVLVRRDAAPQSASGTGAEELPADVTEQATVMAEPREDKADPSRTRTMGTATKEVSVSSHTKTRLGEAFE